MRLRVSSITRPKGRVRIETLNDGATDFALNGITRPKGRVRIETDPRR